MKSLILLSVLLFSANSFATQIPHKMITPYTQSDVGLSNVDNTSDATKNAAAVSITNHTIDASLNTLSNIGDGSLTTPYIKADGTRAFTGDQSLGSHKLTNVTDPASAQDAATKNYVDTAVSGVTSASYADTITLVSGDITNQYVNLSRTIQPNSLRFTYNHVTMILGVDYSLSTVASVTRVTFLGDLATGGNYAAISGDIFYFQYN